MKLQVTFANPEKAIRDHLADQWDGRTEDYAPTTFTNAFPAQRLAGDVTHVQVELDGTPSAADYPVTERSTVRVTCWAAPGKPSHAMDVATRCQAFVNSHPGDADVWSTVPLTGRLKGTDPDTRNSFVSFTTRVNMRPTAL